MSRTEYLPEALEDLYSIWQHVAEQSRSEEIADRLIDAIDDTCQSYATQPLMGQARSELADEVRCFPVGKYVVFYLPYSDGIEVIQVIHGARDIPKHFRG